MSWEDFLEKETATHSSILAWKVPRTEEPRWLQSMGSQRVGHDLVTVHSMHGATQVSKTLEKLVKKALQCHWTALS